MTDVAWRQWAHRLPVDGPGARLVDSPMVDDEASARHRADALEALGYVPVPAHVHLCDGERRSCVHRHVALLVDQPFDQVAAGWLRDLSSASVRAHLVVCSASVRNAHTSVARERAPADLFGDVGGDPRYRRARRLLAGRRRASALPWLRAAVAAAARRRDHERLAWLAAAYAQEALRTGPGEWATARAVCRRLLPDLAPIGPRSRVVAALAQVWLRTGHLPEAVAVLAGCDIECQLSEGGSPRWLHEAMVDVALCRGRWHEAAAAIDALPAGTADTLGRLALCAWLRQDRATLLHLAPSLRGLNGGGWAVVGALLGACVLGDVELVRTRAADARRDHTVVWLRAVAVEALRVVEARTEAAVLLRQARRGCGVGSLESVLLAHLDGDSGARDAAARMGADGVRRWGEWRGAMSTWGGVSVLLDEVNDAEDDGAALRRGCRWVRAHTGTGHVCVITAATGAPLHADPDGAQPGADDVRAPIRQGGVTLGWVSAARRARDADDLAGCVKALASACAPAVRARLDVLGLHANGDALAGDLLGQSPVMAALRTAIARVAPTTFPVLIEGESGVGKELVARAIHRLSARRDRRLAAINCAAVTDDLFEAELFGHTRGAFTGATGPRVGLIEEAHQGTLFLDEVGELSPRAQAKLLRVLQEGEIRRLGDNQPRVVDVRVVAATNRSLAEAAASGAFREDLVFRLAVVRLVVPPLRDRIEDVPALAQTFWQRATRHRDTRAWLAPDALAALCRHRWPGNVRQLQNVMAGLVLAAPTRGRVTARHVGAVLDAHQDAAASPVLPLGEARRALERRLVTAALARHAGSRVAAARDLGLSRQGLAKLMARLQVAAGSGG